MSRKIKQGEDEYTFEIIDDILFITKSYWSNHDGRFTVSISIDGCALTFLKNFLKGKEAETP